MQNRQHKSLARTYLFGVLGCLLLSPVATAYARGDGIAASDTSLSSGGAAVAKPDSAGVASNAGPVRMVRFSLVQGDVTWRSDPAIAWAKAAINLPVQQGAQVYAPKHARAELTFDDGSVLRLGAGAVATFQALYSDADGEFTEIKVVDGLASLRLRN